MHHLNRIQKVSKLSVTSCKKEVGQSLCSYDTWIFSVPQSFRESNSSESHHRVYTEPWDWGNSATQETVSIPD